MRNHFRLVAETMRTVEWLAKRLHLGSRACAHHLLRRARKVKDDDKNKTAYAHG